jgi:hypothetical protein
MGSTDERDNEPYGSAKSGEFPDQLSNYQLMEKYSAQTFDTASPDAPILAKLTNSVLQSFLTVVQLIMKFTVFHVI